MGQCCGKSGKPKPNAPPAAPASENQRPPNPNPVQKATSPNGSAPNKGLHSKKPSNNSLRIDSAADLKSGWGNPPHICITQPSPLHSRSDISEMVDKDIQNLETVFLKTIKDMYLTQSSKFLEAKSKRSKHSDLSLLYNPYNSTDRSTVIIFNRSKDQILDVAGVLDHGLVGKRPAVFVSSKNMLTGDQQQIVEYNSSRPTKKASAPNDEDPQSEAALDHNESRLSEVTRPEMNVANTTHLWRIQTHQNNSKHKTIHCYNDDSLVLQVVGQRLLIMPYKPSETGQHFLVEEK